MVWSPLVLGTILPTWMMKRGPLCRLLDRFFHGKFKGSSVPHHGHIHLFDMNSGMAILYVQCHTTFKLNGCKLLHNLLQPPFKRCNWGHGPGGNMTLRSIIALVMPVLIWISPGVPLYKLFTLAHKGKRYMSTCMAHLSFKLLPKNISWFPRNLTGKCIPYAETCCRSFAMNAHTSWFLACLPLSAQRHPFPLEKRQSLGCPFSQRISVHRRRTAYFQRMAVFQFH